MSMRRRLAAGGTAAALALTGIAVTTAGAAWAVATDTSTSDTTDTTDENDGTGDTSTERPSIVERIAEALAGLVDDGTITEDQAAAVAEELASSEELRGGPMGHGPHGWIGGMERPGLEAAAETLNLTEDELRSALRDGSSLAEIAEEQGVAVDDLVDALVAAAEDRLAQAVEDGRITQERADEIAATLPERVAEALERTWEPRGPGHRGHRGGMHSDDGTTEDGTAPDESTDGSTEGSSLDRSA
ncbi:hypothetical protein GA707_11825 [Nostocoides sp. F2B08]|uniref:hypothetical protein n=1 Tax=Nostocoides sp. F2B08 TaxID=2653936 RepID=UPI001263601E|nr:hypothetical protein [Tetrasphaera sp. F2B08]KAB7744130.1 hypothetical protein GA707_11825 [Tetrasphaera sp. F2B08]